MTLLVLWGGMPLRPIQGEEPYQEFLAALQERNYHDLAVLYLERMAASQLAPDELKRGLDFQRGSLLVHEARVAKTLAIKSARFASAEQAFQQFLKQQPDDPMAPEARTQLGSILVERARGLITKAKEASDGKSLLQQAFTIYAEAHSQLSRSQEEIATQLKSLNGERDRDKVARRDQLRSDYVQSKMMAARVLLEQAETLKHEPKAYKAKLSEAAAAFNDIAQKYRNQRTAVSALYAVLHEGECYQRLEEYKRSLSYFTELLQVNDNSTAVRLLKTKALTLAIASWLKDETHGPDLAIEAGKQWLTSSRGNENELPAWDELKFALAQAYQAKSDHDPNKTQADRALKEARDLANDLAKRRGPVQQQAQQLLVALGRGESTPTTSTPSDPQAVSKFSEVYTTAKQLIDDMKVADASVNILRSQHDQVTNPADKETLKGRMDEASQKSQELGQRALEFLERANGLATPDDEQDLNVVRYYLAFLYYSRKEYYQAAVLSSWVALHHPEGVPARECANVALAAYQELQRELPTDRREIAQASLAAQTARIAELIMTKWPESQSNAALTTLVRATIDQGDLAKAESYLSTIPADSPRRADAELKTGQAFWRTYRQHVLAQRENPANSKVPADLDQLKQKALQMLTQGIARLGEAPVDEFVARSALTLAQVYVDCGQPMEALTLLNHERLGPLTLVDSNHTAIQAVDHYDVETYRLAIRAYVTSAASANDPDASIEKAQAMLDKLRQRLSTTPEGSKTMIAMYVELARELQQQLEIAAPEIQRPLSSGFETFLRGAAEESDDVAILNWVAHTFFSLGKGLEQNQKEESTRFYRESATAFDKVLTAAKKQGPNPEMESLMTQAYVKQSQALRMIGEYESALKAISAALKTHGRVLSLQVDAAETLQAWGKAGNAKAYWDAVQGSVPAAQGKNLIWGWALIAKTVGKPDLLAKNEEYVKILHQARYNTAYCYFHYSKSKGKLKNDLLKQAKSVIMMTYQLYPTLGGDTQKQAYLVLLKNIQSELGEKPRGFAMEGK